MHRLSVKALRLYGTVRVDLMHQAHGGLRVTKDLVDAALAAGGGDA